MRMHEALLYLPIRGISPLARTECSMPGCSAKFIIANGVAFPGTSGGEEVSMFFFCSEECYLAGIPTATCPRC